MWSSFLQKYFPSGNWRKYYKNIIFYMQCINFGLKPSFMWDFGPASVHPEHLSHFLQDLKQSSLICDDIIVITIEDNKFITNTYYLLESLKKTYIIMDITKREREWALCKGNNSLKDVIVRLKLFKKYLHNGIFTLQLSSNDCLPSIFGLLLGYPLIYYFHLNYYNFSLALKLYKVVCRFEFCNVSDEFQISSFSIPENLCSEDVEAVVMEWFHSLRSINAVMFHDLKIQQSHEYVNSLNL